MVLSCESLNKHVLWIRVTKGLSTWLLSSNLKKTAHHRCRNLAFKRKIYGLWSCVLQKPTKKKITEVIFRILKNKNLLTCKWSRKKKIKVLSNLHSVTYNLLSAKLTQNVQPLDCFAFIQLTFGNTSLKRDFKFASSHLEDLNIKYTANTNKDKIHVNWGEGAEIMLFFLMEKQSSCPSLRLLMTFTVLARNKKLTI